MTGSCAGRPVPTCEFVIPGVEFVIPGVEFVIPSVVFVIPSPPQAGRGIYSNSPAKGFRIGMMINRLFFFPSLFLMKEELPPVVSR